MGNGGQPKQYIPLLGDPILAWTLRACAATPGVDAIVLVVADEDVSYCQQQADERWRVSKPVYVVAGGNTRQQSVALGVEALPPSYELVAVHDGVRPLMRPKLLQDVLLAAQQYGAATTAVQLKDTVKHVEDGWVVSTPDRATLRAVQTPQAFQRKLLVSAHKRATAEKWHGTDDATLVERAGHRVRIVTGSYANIKITTPEDLLVAETLLRVTAAGGHVERIPPASEEIAVEKGNASGSDPMQSPHNAPTLRVGIGYDVHQLVEGRPLILGGVNIPAEVGLAGHSDADVLTHAVIDALLGAAALGDIGRLFPDSSERFKDISSVSLLADVVGMLSERGWNVGNVDVTVAAERPKLAPFVPEMVERLSATLGVLSAAVSVKATTSEGLGFVGTGEGMAAHAVASLYRRGDG